MTGIHDASVAVGLNAWLPCYQFGSIGDEGATLHLEISYLWMK